MAESWTLVTPIYPGPATSAYSIRFVHLNWEKATLEIGWKDNQGIKYEHVYAGPTATALMVALNKINLSVKSLHKRIFEQLKADGLLNAGSTSGSPD